MEVGKRLNFFEKAESDVISPRAHSLSPRPPLSVVFPH